MRKVLVFLGLLTALFCYSSNMQGAVYAADIRTGSSISIAENEKNLADLYLFGTSITVNAPVKRDIVAAGQDIVINRNISGNILTAGGNLRVKGDSGGSVRAAGGNIEIDGNIEHDLVVAGGSVTIAKSAVIKGDLIAAGGELNILGRVDGKAWINGGKVRIDGQIKKQARGSMDKLALGSGAVIGGDLIYSSAEKAKLADGAKILGSERFSQTEKKKDSYKEAGSFLTGFSIYKLIADIILTISFIYFFGAFLRSCFDRMAGSALMSGIYGLGFLVLMPVAAMIFLVLLWLGAGLFIFYALVILVASYIAKAYAGWYLIKWWYKRDKKTYLLDWKAGIAGPIVLFIIGYIPFLGWLFLAVLYLISFGALVNQLAVAAKNQKLPRAKK